MRRPARSAGRARRRDGRSRRERMTWGCPKRSLTTKILWSGSSVWKRARPRGIKRFWWVVAIVVLGVFLFLMLR